MRDGAPLTSDAVVATPAKEEYRRNGHGGGAAAAAEAGAAHAHGGNGGGGGQPPPYDDEDEEPPALELTTGHAFGFIIVASSALLVLFFVDLYLTVNVLFSFSAASSTAQVTQRERERGATTRGCVFPASETLWALACSRPSGPSHHHVDPRVPGCTMEERESGTAHRGREKAARRGRERARAVRRTTKDRTFSPAAPPLRRFLHTHVQTAPRRSVSAGALAAVLFARARRARARAALRDVALRLGLAARRLVARERRLPRRLVVHLPQLVIRLGAAGNEAREGARSRARVRRGAEARRTGPPTTTTSRILAARNPARGDDRVPAATRSVVSGVRARVVNTSHPRVCPWCLPSLARSFSLSLARASFSLSLVLSFSLSFFHSLSCRTRSACASSCSSSR